MVLVEANSTIYQSVGGKSWTKSKAKIPRLAAALSPTVAIGTGDRSGEAPNWRMNMERPYGQTLISNYALVKQRHMYQYGTTNEQLAGISISTRHHAMRNPDAVRAKTD